MKVTLPEFERAGVMVVGDVMLEVKDLQLTKDSPKINFTVHKGEIVGFSGMVGSGRTEMMRAMVGADSRYGGHIYINGKEVQIKDPNDATALGIGMVHQHFKLIDVFTVLDNIILGAETTKCGFLQKKEIGRASCRERVSSPV